MRVHPQSGMHISEQTKSSSHENTEQECPQTDDDRAKVQVGQQAPIQTNSDLSKMPLREI